MGFAAVFSFSFAASLHCAFMCSPLVCASIGKRAKISKAGIWLYNFGRILSYAGAGFALGAGGEWLNAFRPQWGMWLSKSLGGLIIGVGLLKFLELVSGRRFSFLSLTSLTSAIGNGFNRLNVFPTVMKDFLLGVFTVVLPCMTLTPALSASAATGSALKGTLYMLAFGLGTLPVMLGATYVPLVIYRKIPEKLAAVLVVVFILVTGIITFIRH